MFNKETQMIEIFYKTNIYYICGSNQPGYLNKIDIDMEWFL